MAEEYVRLDQFGEFTKRIDQRFDDLHRLLDARFDGIERRFTGLEQRFTGLDQRLDNLERRLDSLGNTTQRQMWVILAAVIGALVKIVFFPGT